MTTSKPKTVTLLATSKEGTVLQAMTVGRKVDVNDRRLLDVGMVEVEGVGSVTNENFIVRSGCVIHVGTDLIIIKIK